MYSDESDEAIILLFRKLILSVDYGGSVRLAFKAEMTILPWAILQFRWQHFGVVSVLILKNVVFYVLEHTCRLLDRHFSGLNPCRYLEDMPHPFYLLRPLKSLFWHIISFSYIRSLIFLLNRLLQVIRMPILV